MYLGVATPTEAAAGGAFGAMLVGFSYRRLNFKLLREATLTATNTSCMVLCLFYGGKILSYGLARLDAPGEIARTVGSLPVSAMIVFAGICFMYLVLGCVMEGLSMIIVTLPITYPIMMTLGFDSIWFGIVIVLLEEIAMITPPYGINLFVIHHISGGRSMADVIIGAAPYVVIMLGMIALLTIFPQLALWLPSMMK
jgi:tripartite ATP-independent transporter DctM subunit